MTKARVEINNQTILITGAAGFIGFHLAKRLLNEYPSAKIIGLDSLNDYYDVSLKKWRLSQLKTYPNFTFTKGNLANKKLITELFEVQKPNIVVNLAAQAGVRYSIDHPDAYIESNIIGFYNILEACRHNPVNHLVFASSSSVYGDSKKTPFSTDDITDSPVSLYAATKKSDELLAHCYSKLYNIPCTGLRFFTVYGPAGRPDMAYFNFTKKLIDGESIEIFNYGKCKRDFTYIDDAVESIVRIIHGAPKRKNGKDGLPLPPYAVYNIGNNHPETLLSFISTLQKELIRAKILPPNHNLSRHQKLLPMQPGDVPITYADTSTLEKDYGYAPNTPLYKGLRKFVEWYKIFYIDKED